MGNLTSTEIALYVADEDEAQLVNLTRELVLGRYGAKAADAGTPIFDLAHFGAMEFGVSRKHALLRRLGSDIVIIDLESTNGTWLNGVQLNPNQPVMLKSGDKILLARLNLQIFLA
jgi:pSer/pThr/pTyr-binding forkhead associated (FHA) protein